MHKFHETRPYLAATSWSEESWKLISSIANHCHTLSFLHDKIPASEILYISRTTQSTSKGTLQQYKVHREYQILERSRDIQDGFDTSTNDSDSCPTKFSQI
jgi:hypothetical protein